MTNIKNIVIQKDNHPHSNISKKIIVKKTAKHTIDNVIHKTNQLLTKTNQFNHKTNQFNHKHFSKRSNSVKQHKNSKKRDMIKIWVDDIDTIKKTRKNLVSMKQQKNKEDEHTMKELLIKHKIINKHSKAPNSLLKKLYLNLNDLGDIQII